jgi:hypothetical protein
MKASMQLDVWLTLTMPDGKQTRILGSDTCFGGVRDALLAEEGNVEAATRQAARACGAREMYKDDLARLRRAKSIEGPSAQLFYLLRALALGPAEGEAA